MIFFKNCHLYLLQLAQQAQSPSHHLQLKEFKEESIYFKNIEVLIQYYKCYPGWCTC